MNPIRTRRGAVRRPLPAVAAAALATVLSLAPASPAAAEIVDPPGSCVGSGTWQEGGFSRDSSSTAPGDVIEIPRADSVAWTGQVNGPQAGEPRPIAGSIALALPPPLGHVTVRDWEGTGINVATAGTEAYELPSQVPAGVVFQLRGQHREGGAVYCSGTAQLRISGGVLDTVWVWVALAGAVALALLLLLLGRSVSGGLHAGRGVAGALAGLLFGVFAALTVLLFGLVPLASAVLTVIMALGLVLGAGWGAWAPLGRSGGDPSGPTPGSGPEQPAVAPGSGPGPAD